MKDIYNCRVLFSFHTDPEYMRPVELTPNQIVCGPLCPDIETAEGVPSMIKTPRGAYDIESIIQKIPKENQPDLLIVKADATRSNLPTGISKLKIPSVLIIGDTHHMQQPLRTMMQYALSEQYTYYVSDHKRHHLHYFIEAGLPNVFWQPGLLVRDWKIPFQQKRNLPLTFVGQASVHHPWRKHILDRLGESEYPIQVGTASQEQASKVYATSTLTLNFSLNGDLNLRVFEVLAAGGCLLTDRLSFQSGLEQLFEDGKHLVLYDGYENLCEKINYLLKNPGEALSIAKAGYEAFNRSHHATRKRRQLLELAFNGWIDPLYDGKRDKRSQIFKLPTVEDFFLRLAQYEWLQEHHRQGDCWNILFTSSKSIKLLCDLVDLPRFQVALLAPDETAIQTIGSAQINQQVVGIQETELCSELQIHCLIVESQQIKEASFEDWINKSEPAVVIISDWMMSPLQHSSEQNSQTTTILTRLGYAITPEESIGIFVK